ncbi:MAG TPA: hypothetical protein VK735_44180 [Pseudonocardia sp.]|uniref:phage tail tube protein n=1 Tax=Pseudonocardia sp. TaxID=60912 RepID=UPI002C2125E6|nr:hypothetical protein [Pseudonocardia sp.]HTF54484.1 hypothetical protein [Pseudonocardia sp.]
MALDDAAVIIPGTGFVYTAPAGTPAPVDLENPESPWEDLGHTSIEDGLTITKDGGDSNILGTWRNPSLRDRRDPVNFAITIHLLQLTNETLAYYFGGGDTSVDGVFGVNLITQPQERAMFIRIVDGEVSAPLYVPRVSLASDDDVEVDVENFLAFPVRATILGVTGSNLMEWYGPGLGLHTNEVQSVAITGTPAGGTFTLTYAGQTTAPIAYNATASAVQTALRALSNVGTSGCGVTGGPGPGTAWVVTFTGDLAGTDVAQMTGSAALLTGGTAPAVVVTTTTPGT